MAAVSVLWHVIMRHLYVTWNSSIILEAAARELEPVPALKLREPVARMFV